MYGVINKSLREMVVEGFGEDTWNSVMAKAGVPSDSFLAMRSYDDEITFRLAVASSDVLGIEVDAACPLRVGLQDREDSCVGCQRLGLTPALSLEAGPEEDGGPVAGSDEEGPPELLLTGDGVPQLPIGHCGEVMSIRGQRILLLGVP